INKLRKKLEPDPSNPVGIRSIHGEGYYLDNVRLLPEFYSLDKIPEKYSSLHNDNQKEMTYVYFNGGKSAYCIEERNFYGEHKDISLRPKEHDVLTCLALSNGKIVPKRTIYDRVWNNDELKLTFVTQYVHKLRKKLGQDIIETVKERGYRLECPVIKSHCFNPMTEQEVKQKLPRYN
ncbi:hypothetical protein GF327_01710, partial [Candidatus Woesearchaeota archaeon]|nr:hypothetical protein [Candidatus Woesearchaeota archaeon]